MGRFSYTVQDGKGEMTSGGLEAVDENEAIAALRGQGYFILSIAAEGTECSVAGKAQGTGQGRGCFWLLALGLPFLASALLDLRSPDSPPAPLRTSQASTVLEQAAPLFLPARLPRDEARRLLRAAELMVDSEQLQIILPADGRSLKSEARFSYDPKRRELRPINESARCFLDIRRVCPKL